MSIFASTFKKSGMLNTSNFGSPASETPLYFSCCKGKASENQVM